MSTVFSFLVLHMAQLGASCGEFEHLSEGDYLCDSCSGWIETMGTSFYLSGPSRKSGGHKDTYRKLWAFPPVTWHDPLSTRVVNVQPNAGDTGTDVSKSLTLCLSEATRFWGKTDTQTYYFSPVWWELWWCGYTHTSEWCWRLEGNMQRHFIWNNKIQKSNVGCGVPWWLSDKRFCLPTQETQVWSLVWEVPTSQLWNN